jgi:NitT/TauT family transport system permease protein/sulfonate transport system permease protein
LVIVIAALATLGLAAFGAPNGLGYLMLRAQTAADSTTFLATCFVIVLIFTLGERLVIVPLERRFERR